MLLSSTDPKKKLMHIFLFTNSARENWFQYERRVYATAIKFPCNYNLALNKEIVHLLIGNTIKRIFTRRFKMNQIAE